MAALKNKMTGNSLYHNEWLFLLLFLCLLVICLFVLLLFNIYFRD